VVRTGPVGNGGIGAFPLLLSLFPVSEVGRGDFGPPFPDGDLDLLARGKAVGNFVGTFFSTLASTGSCVNFLGFNHILPSVFGVFSISFSGVALFLCSLSAERGRSEMILSHFLDLRSINTLLWFTYALCSETLRKLMRDY